MWVWTANLAKKYNKANPWLYGLLALVTYIVFIVILGFILGFVALASNSTAILNLPPFLLTLMAIPFGILGVWILRSILARNWKKEVNDSDQVLDDTSEF